MSFGETERSIRNENEFKKYPLSQSASVPDESRDFVALERITSEMIALGWKYIWDQIQRDGGAIPFCNKHLPEDVLITTDKFRLSVKCDAMGLFTSDTIERLIKKWVKKTNKVADGNVSEANVKLRIHQTMLGILRRDTEFETPVKQLSAGFRTGVSQPWKMAGNVIEVYEQQFGTQIDQQTFHEILSNSKNLLLKIASTHLGIFQNFAATLRPKGPLSEVGINEPIVASDYFLITGDAPNRNLELTESFLAYIESEDYEDMKKHFTGCPALFAQGVVHPNVILDVYLELVVPTATHYLRNYMRKT